MPAGLGAPWRPAHRAPAASFAPGLTGLLFPTQVARIACRRNRLADGTPQDKSRQSPPLDAREHERGVSGCVVCLGRHERDGHPNRK